MTFDSSGSMWLGFGTCWLIGNEDIWDYIISDSSYLEIILYI